MGRSPGKKLQHRFYEPLVLLQVLDPFQGDHEPRQREGSPPLDHTLPKLRRRFLNELAYVCDYKKGGDTVTAIFASSCPLVYHLATNKLLLPENKVVSFLESLLEHLRDGPSISPMCAILEKCVAFSEERITTYLRFLRIALKECRGRFFGHPQLRRRK
jgi:hypothetical protein